VNGARAAGLALALGCALVAGRARAVQPGTQYAADPRATGLLVEDVRFSSSRDSVPLNGWWFAGRPNMPVLVLCPRGKGTMADLLPGVLEWSRRGFGVLTFDLRDFGPGGPGEADSLRDIVYASRWVNDTEGALACARRHAAGQPVFALGQDLGGPLALAACARQRGNADGVAVEGLFRTAQEQLLWLGVSQNPEIVRRHRALVEGADDPAAAVSRLHVPLFVVVAMKDEITPPDVTKQLALECSWAAQTWVLPAAGHDGVERTPGYYDRLAEWFGRTAIIARRARH
jgi:pimeloyl-ACP methyl ester carboxylesterase